MSNRQNLDWFVNALCDQNNGTMGAEPRVRRTLTRRDNHLLINLWFLSQYLMKFNDIFHKYRTELFWFDVIIFVPLIRTEILHFSGISLGGRTLGTPVYFIVWTIYKLWKTNEHTILKLWTLIKNIIERTHKFPYNILFTFLMDRGRAPNGIGHLMILVRQRWPKSGPGSWSWSWE